MFFEKNESVNCAEPFWNDLSITTKEAIMEFLGERENYGTTSFSDNYYGSEVLVYA